MSDKQTPDLVPSPPFATPDDLAKRWHGFESGEKELVETLMEDASDIIMGLQPHWQQLPAATLKRICCQMVKRAMIADSLGVGVGVTQVNQTTGPFTDGMTFANPTGDLYLLDSEKRSLGIGRQQAFHVHMEGCAHDRG
ncbi:Gp19/Gp15/Gp42 family protein [Bifidobacterium cuniculi]|uniref:Phage protein Gp19/Gp15/Gp42 n=1 Tax=Bifidobacterium cuniculi TaxID=1688 RepID=A0A087B405_9BIFI|nr:Gp19/Gp15/Gp42 family protein [Bifidobacterium cuniculi]KFI65755.1 phage protein Gp19/Gp15/Gp42 [Bifidobacterium cuniculi]